MQAGRAALLIQPTDRLSITLGFMHQSLTQDGPNTIDSPPLNEMHYQPFDVAEPFEDKFDLYTLTGKYNFDSFQLVSAIGLLGSPAEPNSGHLRGDAGLHRRLFRAAGRVAVFDRPER